MINRLLLESKGREDKPEHRTHEAYQQEYQRHHQCCSHTHTRLYESSLSTSPMNQSPEFMFQNQLVD